MRGPSQVFAHVHCVQSLLNRRLSVTWKTIQTFYNFNTKWFPFSQCRFCRFKRSIPDRLFLQISFPFKTNVLFPILWHLSVIKFIWYIHDTTVSAARDAEIKSLAGQLEASFYLVWQKDCHRESTLVCPNPFLGSALIFKMPVRSPLLHLRM